MSNINRVQLLLAGVTAAALLAAAAPAYAVQAEKTVQVTYQNIRVSVNGRMEALKDSDENAIEPFNYNGTVYLPVRGISQALGLTVDYDSTSNTVILTGTVASDNSAAVLSQEGAAGEQQAGSPLTPRGGDGQTGTFPAPPSGDGQIGTSPTPPGGNGQTSTPPALPSGDGQPGTPPADGKAPGKAAATTEAVVKNVSSIFKDIHVTLNGKLLALKDSDGNTVEPFIFNGSTYLPVRAISEALGLTVSYDEAAKIVKVGNNNAQGPGDHGGPGTAMESGASPGTSTGSTN